MDSVIEILDNFLKSSFGGLSGSGRENPAGNIVGSTKGSRPSGKEKLSGQLMRINHAGEVAAQGLYQGQLFLEKDANLRAYLQQAAEEEADHLNWTGDYLRSKGVRGSLLNPVWYIGSFALGVLMRSNGRLKSKLFLAETERQVQEHLSKNIKLFPAEDESAAKIINKMFEDEGEHAEWAEDALTKETQTEQLTRLEKRLMRIFSSFMIILSRRI